jgi:putative redox protein
MSLEWNQCALTTSKGRTVTQMEVAYIDGESYEIAIRGHRVVVDQPAEAGGADAAPTPTELFVASLASCVAFYAGRYLTRHGYSRTGLSVSASFEFAVDRPSRVREITMDLKVPTDLPESRWPALAAVAGHCTVHNTINNPPIVSIKLT